MPPKRTGALPRGEGPGTRSTETTPGTLPLPSGSTPTEEEEEEEFQEVSSETEALGGTTPRNIKASIAKAKQFQERTRKELDLLFESRREQEAAVATRDKKLDDLAEQSRDLDARLGRLEGQLESDSAANKVNHQQTQLDIVDTSHKVREIDTKLDGMDDRLSSISETLERLVSGQGPAGLNTSTPARGGGVSFRVPPGRHSIIPPINPTSSASQVASRISALEQGRLDGRTDALLTAAQRLGRASGAGVPVTSGPSLSTSTLNDTTVAMSTSEQIQSGSQPTASQTGHTPTYVQSGTTRPVVTFGDQTRHMDYTLHEPAVSQPFGHRLFNTNPVYGTGTSRHGGPARRSHGVHSQPQPRQLDPNQSLYLNQSVRMTPGGLQPGITTGFNVNNQGFLTLDQDSNPEDFFQNVPVYDPDHVLPNPQNDGMDPFRLIYGCAGKVLQELRSKVKTLQFDYEWDDFIESLLSMSTFAPGMTDFGYKNIIYDKIKVANTDLQSVVPRRHVNTPLLDYILMIKQLVAPPYNATQLRVCFENLKQKPDQFIEHYIRMKFTAYKRMIANGEQESPHNYFRNLVDGLYCRRLKKMVVGFRHQDNFSAMSSELLYWSGWIQNELRGNLISETKAKGTATCASQPPPSGEKPTTDQVHELVLQSVNSLSAVNAKSFPNRRFNRFRRDVKRDTCFYCKQSGHWAKDCPKKKYGQDRAKRVMRANKHLNACGATYRIDLQGEILTDCSKLSNVEPYESESELNDSEISDSSGTEEEDELNQLHRNQRSTRKGQRRRFRSGRKPFGKRRYFRKRKDGSINIVEATVEGDEEIFDWDQAGMNHLEPESKSEPSSEDTESPQSLSAPDGTVIGPQDQTPSAASINTIGTLTADFSHYEQDLNLIETDEDYFTELHIDPSEKYYQPQIKEANLSTLGNPPMNPTKLKPIDRDSTLDEMSKIVALMDNQISPDTVELTPPDYVIDQSTL